MTMTTCEGYKLARHAQIVFDNDGSFCPACEAMEENEKLRNEIAEDKAALRIMEEQLRKTSNVATRTKS